MTQKQIKPSEMQPSILIANGVNLDLLGTREPSIYGKEGLDDIRELLLRFSQDLAQKVGFAGCQLKFFQTNNEAEFLGEISKAWDGALLNLGAWTHTSLAIADRLAALELNFVEVHISNLAQREDFRHHSYSAKHANGVVYGMGIDSYLAGLTGLLRSIHKNLQAHP